MKTVAEASPRFDGCHRGSCRSNRRDKQQINEDSGQSLYANGATRSASPQSPRAPLTAPTKTRRGIEIYRLAASASPSAASRDLCASLGRFSLGSKRSDLREPREARNQSARLDRERSGGICASSQPKSPLNCCSGRRLRAKCRVHVRIAVAFVARCRFVCCRVLCGRTGEWVGGSNTTRSSSADVNLARVSGTFLLLAL